VLVSRNTLRDAVDAGIAAVHEYLTADEVSALRGLANNAAQVGTNFHTSPPCPAALVGLEGAARIRFADAYDDVLIGTGLMVFAVESIMVTD
jgi:hypothetical protein